MKTTITESGAARLEELLGSARVHNEALEEILKEVRHVTGEQDEYGYSWDAVFESMGLDWLLRQLGLAATGTPEAEGL